MGLPSHDAGTGSMIAAALLAYRLRLDDRIRLDDTSRIIKTANAAYMRDLDGGHHTIGSRRGGDALMDSMLTASGMTDKTEIITFSQVIKDSLFEGMQVTLICQYTREATPLELSAPIFSISSIAVNANHAAVRKI